MSQAPHTYAIVDDQPTLVNALKRLLKIKRKDLCFVGSAESEQEAIKLIRHHAPSLLILDLTLRGGNALGVLAATTAWRQESGTQTLIMTGYGHPSLHQLLKAAGVSEVLTKDLDVQRIVAVINQLLDHPEPPRSRLSDETLSVAALTLAGVSDAEIANELGQTLPQIEARYREITSAIKLPPETPLRLLVTHR